MLMKKTLQFMGGALLAATVLTSGAQAATNYSSLFVFGDSLSDSGNNAFLIGGGIAQTVTGNTYIPGPPYAPSNTYSNGEIWATQFATMAGLGLDPSKTGGTNYAQGGARVSYDVNLSGLSIPSLNTQLTNYLTAPSTVVQGNGLYVLAGGGNDARDILEALAATGDFAAASAAIQTYAFTVRGMVNALQGAGAQHIVVWNTPNLGLTPIAIDSGSAAFASMLTGQMNGALSLALDGTGVQVFDLFNITAGAAAAGITNLTSACGAVAVGQCGSALFYDAIHPTTAAHAVIASQMFALTAPVPEPSEMAMLAAGLVLVVTAVRRRRR